MFLVAGMYARHNPDGLFTIYGIGGPVITRIIVVTPPAAVSTADARDVIRGIRRRAENQSVIASANGNISDDPRFGPIARVQRGRQRVSRAQRVESPTRDTR